MGAHGHSCVGRLIPENLPTEEELTCHRRHEIGLAVCASELEGGASHGDGFDFVCIDE